MDRQDRLKSLQKYLNDNGDREYNFDTIYEKLLSEFSAELSYNDNMRENLYLNNLRQTRDKQAAHYIHTKQKRPKSSCYSEFREFVSNFEHDVMEGLRLHVKPATDTTIENDEV